MLRIKSKATALFLTVLLTSALAIMYTTEKVRADGTIYIRPDGSVDPPTAPIQRDGGVYTFTDNISETIVVERDNIAIDGNVHTLQGAGSGTGFDLSNRNNVTIRNTHITEWNYGIHLYNLSSDNTIRNNNLTKNVLRAIFLSNSSDNTIRDNNVVNNLQEGIFIWRTNTTVVTGNNISNNGEDGISIAYSSFYSTIANNTVADNTWAGISIGFEVSTGNVITGNNITNNVWAGIYIDHSNGNIFHHNNLLYNIDHQVVTVGATNIWDNNYPSGGNYWSDYTGQDLNGDGIGDTPYNLDANNQDKYPFINPWTQQAYDTAITAITPFKTVVGQGYTLQVNVTVMNQGSYTQAFKVTTYSDSTPIETKTVTLESRKSTTLTFAWDTIGSAKGNYKVWAHATPVPGEVDTADNNLEDGVVMLSVPGDINGDKTVDALDLYTFGKAYGATSNSPNWNPNANINSDGIVDKLDLEIISQNYGKSDR